MILKPTAIAGAFVVEIEPRADERGFFARTYCVEELHAGGAAVGPLRQTSISFNLKRGTLRGMHWQAETAAENKLVRASSGRAFDVFVDIRPASASYLKWIGVELDASRHNAVFIPKGCAHGFLTLTDNVRLEYAMDIAHAPDEARGARWNDPAFAIQWPFEPLVMGARDLAWPDFQP